MLFEEASSIKCDQEGSNARCVTLVVEPAQNDNDTTSSHLLLT